MMELYLVSSICSSEVFQRPVYHFQNTIFFNALEMMIMIMTTMMMMMMMMVTVMMTMIMMMLLMVWSINEYDNHECLKSVFRTRKDIHVLEGCEIPPIRTSFVEDLGEGAFGRVHKAKHTDALELFTRQQGCSRANKEQFVAVKELYGKYAC